MIRGYFFFRENFIDMIYKFDERKVVIVYVAIVRYICFDFRIVKRGRKLVFKVLVDLNEEILVFM